MAVNVWPRPRTPSNGVQISRPSSNKLHDLPRLHDVPAEQPAEIHRTCLRVTQELIAVDCRGGVQGC